MPIEGGCCLSAEVAVPKVEVDGADAVRAADAGELYGSFDPLGSVVCHGLIESPRGKETEHLGLVAKVMGETWLNDGFRVPCVSNSKRSIVENRRGC